MYVPQFPYTGNQAIITSGRVTHHSYDDFIFLFGKKGVAINLVCGDEKNSLKDI